jgi:hypothetical protein
VSGYLAEKLQDSGLPFRSGKFQDEGLAEIGKGNHHNPYNFSTQIEPGTFRNVLTDVSPTCFTARPQPRLWDYRESVKNTRLFWTYTV